MSISYDNMESVHVRSKMSVRQLKNKSYNLDSTPPPPPHHHLRNLFVVKKEKKENPILAGD